jgi:hypothetical protein
MGKPALAAASKNFTRACTYVAEKESTIPIIKALKFFALSA